MRIALHTPLNDPEDGGTSGDRRMARQLRAVLAGLGHEVQTVPQPRTHTLAPDPDGLPLLLSGAKMRQDELAAGWAAGDPPPELWLTYHNYHKAPDLMGPDLSGRLAIPYVLVEASHTPSKLSGPWAARCRLALRATLQADCHFCFTAQDRAGLVAAGVAPDRLAGLPPFIDTAPFEVLPEPPAACTALRLVTVAMMRAGGKLDSYRALSQALAVAMPDLPWRLTVVGDGAARRQVEDLFAGFGPDRVRFAGLVAHSDLPALLSRHDAFVWPGLHEPFGLVFLEAQGAGLPVVAFDSGGVADTVRARETALLVPEGDTAALAAALARLASDKALRRTMGQAARAFVLDGRGLTGAATIIRAGLSRAAGNRAAREQTA